MELRERWSRILCVAGMLTMVVGCLDPMEGAFLILAGSGLLALGAHLGRSRHRKLVFWAFALTAVGVAILFGLSAVGGLGGETGRSMLWALVLLPYPAGAIMALVTGLRILIEIFRR
jgi:hypothetical protein